MTATKISTPAALVTGAAGGVGRATVTALVARGYAVIATDLDPSVEAMSELSAAEAPVVGMVSDVRDPDASRLAVDAALSAFGRLDVLVNNAGRFLRKHLLDTEAWEFDQLMMINARSAFLHSRDALPYLRETKGCIVNLASTSGFVGVTGQPVYAMTKGAIVQLTRQLAVEEAARGVRVNAVAPGAIDTAFTAEAQAADPDPESSLKVSIARHPIGRYSTPAEVAEGICFLASPASSGITGTILSIDGGYLAQ